MKPILKYSLCDKYVEDCYILFLPIQIDGKYALPKNLQYCEPLIKAAIADYRDPYRYVYLSIDSRFCPQDSYHKRPGWHVDGFKTTDENYCWVNLMPTEYLDLKIDFRPMNMSHEKSMEMFSDMATHNFNEIKEIAEEVLYKMDGCIHRTPLIRKSCHRTFIKISFSNYKYNLKGNAINYLLDYNWEYFDRKSTRNCPIYKNHDSQEDQYESK